MFVFSRAALQRFTGLAVRGPPGSALTFGLRRAYRRARHTQSVSQVEKETLQLAATALDTESRPRRRRKLPTDGREKVKRSY